MRTAEITIALALMGLSVWFMVHASRLPIGWVPEAGPGGGAFPFWLSLGILLCSGALLAREVIGAARDGFARRGRFFAQGAFKEVATVAGTLIITVAMIPWLGTYIAMVVFLLFYLRWLGKRSWVSTLAITVPTPPVVFLFFEVTLKILLPKGVTEPLFIPLYAYFF